MKEEIKVDFDRPRKTQLDLELEEYENKVQSFSEDQIEKELEKISKKLVVNFRPQHSNKKVPVDISNNSEQKNRLFMRNKLMETTKWIGYIVKKVEGDYSIIWRQINATFVSKNILPDYDSTKLQLPDGVKFMDTLSLQGLKMYKKFLMCFANAVLFENSKIEVATKKAKYIQFALMEDLPNEKLFDELVLPKNWQTAYKTIMKQKFCMERERALSANLLNFQ